MILFPAQPDILIRSSFLHERINFLRVFVCVIVLLLFAVTENSIIDSMPFDGICEWKALRLSNSISFDTVPGHMRACVCQCECVSGALWVRMMYEKGESRESRKNGRVRK